MIVLMILIATLITISCSCTVYFHAETLSSEKKEKKKN